MVSENHHLTVDTEFAQVDSECSVVRTHRHHTQFKMGSQMRSHQQQQQQQRYPPHHHYRRLDPEYQHKQGSRSRSRSPYRASPHRHEQDGRRHTPEAFHDGVSPDALTQKLELLEADQSRLQMDPAELQRKKEELLQDIIERLDKNVSEQDPLDLDASDTTTLLQEESQQLNPALLKDHRTLRQHHGNANIRHS
ncbi:hypothetical protein BGZ70_003698 [Mortierella alpina]|uniref:Uncharacterized protein n=1 Tax=Mortierella alpina TaxID=64518 RepID=A0A9P6LVR4_MORAP|nr:hypothetical protein BGZ70_003698 [Mortierella alpina]